MSYLSKSDLLREEIDFLLGVLDGARPERGFTRSTHKLPPAFFKKMEPVGVSEIFDRDEDWFIFGDVAPADVDFSFDISCLSKGKEDGVLYCITRGRSVTPAEVRGRVDRVFPVMAETAVCLVFDSGKYASARGYLAFVNGRWVEADTGKSWSNNNSETGHWQWSGPAKKIDGETELQGAVRACLGLQFSRRYEWVVELEGLSGTSIGFATDPIGAKEIFRLRGIPTGKDRRSALRNWVREHYRKRRNAPGEKSKVRAHLRGATEFVWGDLKCTIHPAQYDLDVSDGLRKTPKELVLYQTGWGGTWG